MPLPRHDEQPLPSRRALREAERARAAASGAPDRAVRPRGERPAAPVVPPPAVRSSADGPGQPVAGTVRVVDVAQAERDAARQELVVDLAQAERDQRHSDQVRREQLDSWADAVVPRPTPVASRVVPDELDARVPASRDRRSAWRRLPQVLVVGSLVAATLGYATTGDTAATAGEVRAFERAEQTVRAEGATLVAPLEDTSGLVAGEDGLLRVEGGASRGAARTPLPGCDGVPPETAQENGRIDESYLCTLFDGTTQIRADAAVSLALLNEQYRARFGTDICLTDGYRSYAAQVSVRNRKPGLAARPGTSEHGFGLAVDLCGGVEAQGEGYWWLRDNAGASGFENPAWAQRGGGGPFEPWHWEYVAGQW